MSKEKREARKEKRELRRTVRKIRRKAKKAADAINFLAEYSCQDIAKVQVESRKKIEKKIEERLQQNERMKQKGEDLLAFMDSIKTVEV